MQARLPNGHWVPTLVNAKTKRAGETRLRVALPEGT